MADGPEKKKHGVSFNRLKRRCAMRITLFGKKIFCFTIAITLLYAGAVVSSAEEQMRDVSLKVNKLSLFKNGLGFFSAEATLPNKTSSVRIGQLPVPVYGTFWIGYSDKVKIRSLVTFLETIEETVGIQNIGQLLSSNIGCKVLIRTGAGENEIAEGVIMQMQSTSNTKEPPNPYFMETRGNQDAYNRYNDFPGQSGIVLIKTDKNVTAIAVNSIVRADIEGRDIKNTITVKKKRPCIRLEMEHPAGEEKIGVSFLAKGVTWVPSYCIDLSDSKTATLSVKALIINEVMDFDHVSCELVTGFPNIAFSEVVSPEAMSQNLAEFLRALSQGRSESTGRGRYGMMRQQAVLSNSAVGYEQSDVSLPAYQTVSEGMASEDLFLYPVKEITLKKGETALIPLFTATMPYKHLYTWKIDDFVDKEEQYQRSSRSGDEKEPGEEVWHSCRLVNTLKMPLTTASAEFMNNGTFAGQDICYYTAPGAETTIKINRALNVIGEQGEIEVDRKRGITQFYGWNYDLVKVKGEMKVKNRLDKTITIEITKHLTGEIQQKKPDAKDVPTAKGLKQVNPRHILTWQMELKPGEEQTASYLYQVYIRN
jgi:hypothetical protein